MWSTVWFSFTFFELYAYFMIYSFLGWAMESTYVSINAKKWVNRGFINGPFCPIYGTGALLILLALKPVSDSILLLFLGGFVIATVVEYLIGLILEKLFHATWWDYSQKPFNIKGRVCLERSVEWGVLTAFVMRVVAACDCDFVAAIPRAWGEFAATLLLAYLAVDTTITVLHILRFNEKLASLSEAHDALQKKLEGTRLYASRQEIITCFESMPAAEFLREFKERMAEENERLEQLREEERLAAAAGSGGNQGKTGIPYQCFAEEQPYRAPFDACIPGMHSKRFDEELKAWKRELMEKRSKKSRKDVSK